MRRRGRQREGEDDNDHNNEDYGDSDEEDYDGNKADDNDHNDEDYGDSDKEDYDGNKADDSVNNNEDHDDDGGLPGFTSFLPILSSQLTSSPPLGHYQDPSHGLPYIRLTELKESASFNYRLLCTVFRSPSHSSPCSHSSPAPTLLPLSAAAKDKTLRLSRLPLTRTGVCTKLTLKTDKGGPRVLEVGGTRHKTPSPSSRQGSSGCAIRHLALSTPPALLMPAPHPLSHLSPSPLFSSFSGLRLGEDTNGEAVASVRVKADHEREDEAMGVRMAQQGQGQDRQRGGREDRDVEGEPRQGLFVKRPRTSSIFTRAVAVAGRLLW
ncbi:hypothetical protein EV360DRAFT_82088 [Lentinula raphanica]|nr:hypothetical protein EV360DRAFT_82088 [Lentinula raphanica]